MRFVDDKTGRSTAAAQSRWDGLGAALPAGMDRILDRLPDGLILVSGEGELRHVNAAARGLTGTDDYDPAAGGSFAAFRQASALDWSEFQEFYEAGRPADCITSGEAGRPTLLSLRFLREGTEIALAMIVVRDLQGIERHRRLASGGEGDSFQFAGKRETPPDFHAQREIAQSLDQAIRRGERALASDARVLLTGESGTGKTELAKFLHRQFVGPKQPFIHVNCGSIPETLFEAEMFGHEKGAYTGALSGQQGLIESADGGTLFLDEVGEMPLAVQAKLLKFLDDGVIQRVGGRKPRRIRCHLISATNRDLWTLVEEGKFRADLYYRLATVPLGLTPLREEPQLTSALIDHYLQLLNQAREPNLSLSADCRAALLDYHFPGNIRQLQNLLVQLSVAVEGEARLEDLPEQVRLQDAVPGSALGPWPGDSMKEQVRAFERALIADAIERLGSKRKAAKALGVDIGTIVRKTKEGEA